MRIPRNCQRLIAFLALHSPAGRAEVAGSLWPEVDDARALGSLRTSIWQIRRCCAGFFIADGDQLRFGECVHVDAIDFEERARRILHKPQSLALTELTCERQELLPGWYDDWVLLERERSRQLQLHVLEAAGEELLSRRKPGPALCAALDAAQVEPLRESAHRLVIRIHISEGNTREAIRHYQRYQRLLRDELGVSPTEQLEELVAGLFSKPKSTE
jgi:DNA-binding SARP family transcriptional activator